VQLLQGSMHPSTAGPPIKVTLPVSFVQQDYQGQPVSGLVASNVKLVDGRDVWRDPRNLLLLAQAGASCQVRMRRISHTGRTTLF
jgi:hypothetical protein